MALAQTVYLENGRYAANEDRYAIFRHLQPGVFDLTDFEVVAQSPTSMALNINPGDALVAGQSTGYTRQGKYFQSNDSSGTLSVGPLAANTAGASMNRVDQVILTIGDSTSGTADDVSRVQIAQGTASLNAQITSPAAANYRTGAVSDATLTSTYKNWLRLADVVVANGAVSLAQTAIVDRRPWAQGAVTTIARAAGASYTTASSTYVVADATNLAFSVELTSGLVILSASALVSTPAVSASAVDIAFFANGTQVPNVGSFARAWDATQAAGTQVSYQGFLTPYFLWSPAAGRYTIDLRWRSTSAQTATLFASGNDMVQMQVQELISGNVNNN